MSEEVAASTSQSVVANSVQDVDCLQFCEYTFKSHHALCDITENTLNDILSADAFLNDIPYDITNEEVQSQVGTGCIYWCCVTDLFQFIGLRFLCTLSSNKDQNQSVSGSLAISINLINASKQMGFTISYNI